MKKSLCLILCVSIIITMSGCEHFFGVSDDTNDSSSLEVGNNNMDNVYYSGVERDFTPLTSAGITSGNFQESLKDISSEKPSEYAYTKVIQGNGYRSLETNLYKKVYDDIEKAVYKISSEKDDAGYYPVKKVVINNETFSEDIIRKIIGAFSDDHPFEFWIANRFGYVYSDNNTIIQLYSSLSPNDCNGAIKQLVSRTNTILSNIPSNLTEYERELYIHNWLMDNCKYDEDAAHLKNKWASFNTYGAIVVGEAVCEGYSKAIQLLLNYVGIYCRLVSGDARNNAHMWNLVYINNSWYHLDATWNDSSKMKRYDYFNVTDDIIKIDHKIYPDFSTLTKDEICGTDVKSAVKYNVDLPKCYATDANYFNVEAIEIKSLGRESDSKIIDEFYKKILEGESYISFQISESLDYDNTLSKMFSQSPYKLFFYIDNVNEMLDGKQINKDNISYTKSEEQRVITIGISFV